MKKNTFVISLILIGLCLQAFSITIHAGENDLILITDSNIYLKYGFKDLGVYYTEDSLVSFDMPFVVSKTNVGVISEKDLTSSVVGSVKDKNCLTVRNPVYSYSVLAENKDYYVINYHMNIKASNQSFSIDFIPKIKGVSYSIFAWWNSSWNYYKPITINCLQIPNTVINFPILLNMTDTNLKDFAQSDGDDIVFTNALNTSVYNHEIEYYASATGLIYVWVNITTLSNATNTVINMYYGNAVCTNQEHKTDTWDTNYVGVYHMNSTTSTVYDSTINGNHLTKGGDSGNVPDESMGFIGYAQNFLSTNKETLKRTGSVTNLPSGYADLSIEVWAVPFLVNTYMQLVNWGEPAIWCKNIGLYETANALYLGKWEFGVYGSIFVDSGTAVAGQWDNLIATHTGTRGGILYENNVATSGTLGYDLAITVNTDLCVGFRNTATDYFKGIIDEVRISKIVRNQTWVTVCYNTVVNSTNGSFYTVGSQFTFPPTSISNVTSFNPTNNSNNVLITTNFSCYVYDDGGYYTTWTIQCSNGYVSSGTNKNATVFLNFTNANSLYHNYTVWVNVTNDNISYHRYYTEFRTGIDYYNQSESNTLFGGVVIFDNYQFFLCLLFTFWLFLLAESIKETYYGLLQFFIAIPIMSMILTDVYLSSLSFGTMIFSTIVAFVVLFVGIIVFIINWFK